MYFFPFITVILTIGIICLLITILIISIVLKKKNESFTADAIIQMWNGDQIKWLKLYEENVGRQADPVTTKYYNSRMIYGLDQVVKDIMNYTSEVYEGRLYMSKQSILITGLLCNAESNIINIRAWFNQLAIHCKDVQFIIVENNSSDNTRALLQEWCDSDHRIHCLCTLPDNKCEQDEKVINLDKLRQTPRWERIREMSRLRNIYIQYIHDNLLYTKYDFMFVMDLDLRGHLYMDGVFHSFYLFQTKQKIEAVSCNGIQKKNLMNYFYYDTFAYVELFSDYIWLTMRDKQKHDRYVHDTITNKYTKNMEPHHVLSAFGGFTIYRTSIFDTYKNIKYNYAPFLISCEHSHFHRYLSNVYVNPRMIYYIEKNMT